MVVVRCPSAVGLLRLFAGRLLDAEAEAANPARGAPQRERSAVGAARRPRCGTRISGPAGNSLRSLRSLRSDTPALKSVHVARCARGPEILRSSPPPNRAAGHPGPALRQRRWRARVPLLMDWRGGRCPPGASCESARSAGGGRRARSAPRQLTSRGVSERRERSERSELPRGRPNPSIAAQSARSADRRTPRPRRVPPAAPAAANARNDTGALTAAPGRRPTC